MSDWGNQVIHLQEKARRFRAAVEPAKLSPREVVYLYNAVLVPRITYCLTIAAPGVRGRHRPARELDLDVDG